MIIAHDSSQQSKDGVKCQESTDMSCKTRPEVLYKQAKVTLDSYLLMTHFPRWYGKWYYWPLDKYFALGPALDTLLDVTHALC